MTEYTKKFDGIFWSFLTGISSWAWIICTIIDPRVLIGVAVGTLFITLGYFVCRYLNRKLNKKNVKGAMVLAIGLVIAILVNTLLVKNMNLYLGCVGSALMIMGWGVFFWYSFVE